MNTYSPKTKQWFVERIGKRIYRDSQCVSGERCCSTCDEVTKTGLVVADEQHAEYLAMIDMDFGAEGICSNYRDTK